MKSKKKKVRFVSTFGDLVEALHKPAHWPALQFEVNEIQRELKVFEAWELRIGSHVFVRCVSFIAQSVKNLGFTQFYVVIGHPRWLNQWFVNERNTSIF